MENVKSVLGRGLAGRVVPHEPPAVVGREHLGRLEVLASERRLTGARGTDEHYERVLGNRGGQAIRQPTCWVPPSSSDASIVIAIAAAIGPDLR